MFNKYYIDQRLRKLTTEGSATFVKNDVGVDGIVIYLSKSFDAVDMSKAEALVLFNIGPDQRTIEYLLADNSDEESGDYAYTWKFSPAVTAESGNVFFSFCVREKDADGNVIKDWNTVPTTFSVSRTIDHSADNTIIDPSTYTEDAFKANVDKAIGSTLSSHTAKIANLTSRVEDLEEGGTGGGNVTTEQIKTAVDNYLEENPVQGAVSWSNKQIMLFDALLNLIPFKDTNANAIITEFLNSLRSNDDDDSGLMLIGDTLYIASNANVTATQNGEVLTIA